MAYITGSVAKEEDLETLIVAQIEGKKNIFAWNPQGEQEVLSASELKAATDALKQSGTYKRPTIREGDALYLTRLPEFYRLKTDLDLSDIPVSNINLGKIFPYSSDMHGKMRYGYKTRSAKLKTPKAAMKIIPLGIGNADPKNKYGNSCFLLKADKDYLIDFPRVMRTGLEERISNVKDILITHTHEDHIGSLPSFLLMRGPKKSPEDRVNIYAMPPVQNDLKDILRKLGLKTIWSENYEVDVEDFVNFPVIEGAPLCPVTDKTPISSWIYKNKSGLNIIANTTVHGATPASSFKIAYRGKKIGISGDCNAESKFLTTIGQNTYSTYEVINFNPIKYYDDYDLLFHEATMTNNPVHTSIKYLEKNFAQLKDKIFLYHIEDEGFKSDVFKKARRGVTYRV